MKPEPKTLDMKSVAAWRRWLAAHHASEREVWLVFLKRHTRLSSIAYGDALDEALCYGWVDSLVKRLDDDRYARKFTPRRQESRWSAANIARYAELKSAGRLAKPGVERAPDGRPIAVPPARSVFKIPEYFRRALATNAAARRTFGGLTPTQQRLCVGWVDSAKRDETKERRLAEAIDTLAAGRNIGLK